MSPSKSINLSRALIFGGAYGNLQATEAIFAQALKLGYQSHEIIFTGDMVAYCGQPQETVDLIRSSGCHIIQGNCEEALAEGAEDCGCGFEDGTACSVLSVQWFQFCRSALQPETKVWMGNLPAQMEATIGRHRFLVCHATPDSINEFVLPSDISEERYILSHESDYEGYITGHSGLPFSALQNGKLWINSGASGMPANDGTSRVWFATIEAQDKGGVFVQHHALHYDAQTAANAMKNVGLNNGYSDCLLSGIWPSMDVLPPLEQSNAGKPLEPNPTALNVKPVLTLA